MSEMLKKARAYEAEKAAQTDKNTRPLFHISAPAGWINDPNGFSVYDGKIHLFYQYYPYAREWGPMHWGHSVTTDMISWEQLPAALAPDQDYDRNGVFPEVLLKRITNMCWSIPVSQRLHCRTAGKRNDRTSASHSGMAGIM